MTRCVCSFLLAVDVGGQFSCCFDCDYLIMQFVLVLVPCKVAARIQVSGGHSLHGVGLFMMLLLILWYCAAATFRFRPIIR